MDYVDTVGRVAAPADHRVSGFADIVARAIFASMLALIAFTAIPYGTVEPWWKAFFIACCRSRLSRCSKVWSAVPGGVLAAERC